MFRHVTDGEQYPGPTTALGQSISWNSRGHSDGRNQRDGGRQHTDGTDHRECRRDRGDHSRSDSRSELDSRCAVSDHHGIPAHCLSATDCSTTTAHLTSQNKHRKTE